jgi:hypothetical protein
VRGMPVEELIAVTGQNAARVFGLSSHRASESP